MTPVALASGARLAATVFRRPARAMHRPRLALLNPSWLCAAGAPAAFKNFPAAINVPLYTVSA